MKTKKPDPERIDEDNPEFTREELAEARLAVEVLPKHVGKKAAQELLGRNIPQVSRARDSTRPALEAGTLFLSFWKITLNNLPQGSFTRRRITADEARRCIDQARAKKALACFSADDLLAPYHKHVENNHRALCRVLKEHFGIALTLRDFMTEPDEDGLFFTKSLDLVEVRGRNRLLVVTCMYVFPDRKKSSQPLLDLEIDPSSVGFHLFQSA